MNASAPVFTPSLVDEIGTYQDTSLADPTVSLWKPRYTGVIKSFSDAKGFGFIECEKARTSFGRDVFIHKNQVDALGGLRMGTEVQFEIELNKNGQPQSRNVVAITNRQSYEEGSAIEALLNECQNSYQICEVLSMHGMELTHYEVVLGLHQLALCRKYEGWQMLVSPLLARGLVDHLMTDTPELLSMTDITRIVYAIAALTEVHTTHVRRYVFESVAMEVKKRIITFTPAQMANLIGCMSQLRRTKREDEVVGELVQAYNQLLASPSCAFPNEDVNIWAMFLACVVRKNFNYAQWDVPPPPAGAPTVGPVPMEFTPTESKSYVCS